MCQTERTSALSTPMPKALVATITSASPAMKRLLGRGPLLGFHAGVVGERGEPGVAQRRRHLVGVACGCRSRRSPAGWPGRPARPRAAPAGAPSSPCPRARRRRRRGWAGRSRSGPGAGRASRSGEAISRRDRPRSPSPCRPSPSAARAARRSAAGAGSRAGSRAPTRRRSAPRRPRAGRSARCASASRKTLRAEPLRRAVDDPRLAVADRARAPRAPPPRSIPEEIIATGCPAAVSRRHWSPHQRDQRADHDRQVLRGQPRQLVAEALAAAGRHHDQRVAPSSAGLHRLALAGPETRHGRTGRAARRVRACRRRAGPAPPRRLPRSPPGPAARAGLPLGWGRARAGARGETREPARWALPP